jgi:hypothetical protein
VDVKKITCPFKIVGEAWSDVFHIGFLVWQILNIIGSQIETERIFSLVGILTNLKRCRLQLENSKKLFFVNINWPNDPKSGCKSPFNSIEIIEINAK